MIKPTAGRGRSAKPGHAHSALRNNVKEGVAAVEALLPAGSPQRAAVGIAAAAGGALLVAAKFGVRSAALTVAAGYLAYVAISGNGKTHKASLSLINDILRRLSAGAWQPKAITESESLEDSIWRR